jgi:hypothetical protein
MGWPPGGLATPADDTNAVTPIHAGLPEGHGDDLGAMVGWKCGDGGYATPSIASCFVSDATPEIGRIRCRRFLGGLLRHYYREAA